MTKEIHEHIDFDKIKKLTESKTDSTLSDIFSLLKEEKQISETFLKFELDLKNIKFKSQFFLVYKESNGSKKLIGVATAYTYFDTKKKIDQFHLHDLVISKEHRTEQLELDLLNYVSKKCKEQKFFKLNINIDNHLEKILNKLLRNKIKTSSHKIGKSSVIKPTRNGQVKSIQLK